MKKIIVVLCILSLFNFPFFVSCKKGEEGITSYNIDCTFSDNKLSGVEKVSFYNDTENSFKTLKFNLFMNAFRKDAKYSAIDEKEKAKCFYDGENFGGIEINSVSEKDDKLVYSICGEDCNILTVELKNEIFPTESVEIVIEFITVLPRVIARSGINNKTVNLGNFYPILCGIENDGFYECVYYTNGDPFFSDVANYNVSITLDEKYIVASSGKITGSKNQKGLNTYFYEIKKARSFCMVLSTEFDMLSDNSLGVEINYYYIDDLKPKQSLETAVKSIKTFNELFGEYPYQTFSVVETPFNEGGMEYPALVYISSFLDESSYSEVIVHETAHQWWQSVVGNNEIKYGFLDEGLAEYSVVLFYENNPEYKIKRQTLIASSEQTYKIFCSVFDRLYKKVDTTMLRSINEYNSEYEYVNIAYIKGCLMHEYLRNGIGDEKYFNGLKDYYKDYMYKNCMPYDLVGAFEKQGVNVSGFFESFFNGSVII